jgi:hypothetical protein
MYDMRTSSTEPLASNTNYGIVEMGGCAKYKRSILTTRADWHLSDEGISAGVGIHANSAAFAVLWE